MSTGPSPINASIAGVPLSNQAVDARKSANQALARKPDSVAIRDTLETSDREADGRQILAAFKPEDLEEPESEGLDVSG